MNDYHAQRQFYRAQRRAYRRQMRGPLGGFGGVIMVIVILSVLTSHWFWAVLPFLFIPFFLLILRPILFGAGRMMNSQPYSQPYQQEQPMYAPPQQQPPVYQAYAQGYASQPPASQPAKYTPESGQQYEHQAQQQQYEEPLTMYPRD